MRAITILAAVLMLCAANVQAQVAVPDFVPGAPRFTHPLVGAVNSNTITPDNPAALAFGLPSRVVAGVHEGEVTDNLGTNPAAEQSGSMLGLRLVGDPFAFAAAQLAVEDDSGTGLTTEDSTDVQASVLFGDMVAVGIGVTSFTSETTLFTSEVDRQSIGVSLRLGDVFYVGIGQISDEIDLAAPPVTTTGERDGLMYGVAVRTEGPWAWYAAVDVIDLDNFDDPLLGQFGGRKLTLLTGQVLAQGVLLGVSMGEMEAKDATDVDVSLQIIDLGWAPAQGFTVTARISSLDLNDGAAATLDDTSELTSLVFGWQF